MPQIIADTLAKIKKDASEKDFVFGEKKPLPSTTVDRKFQRAIEKAGVKRIRVHDLRHSCASYLLSELISIVGVSRYLGHKDVKETLNTYSHLMPDDQTRILYTLNNLGTNLGTKN